MEVLHLNMRIAQIFFGSTNKLSRSNLTYLTFCVQSEYSETPERFIFNREKKMGHIFGPHQVNSFLKRNKFDLLINSGVFV